VEATTVSRLFLVDDHALVREGLRALLEGAGHEVVGEAGDPTAAVAGIVRLQPAIVVLDLSLGERSGFEVLHELARRLVDTRVLILSMSSQPRTVAEAMRLGARGYVLKGAPSAHLLAAIETIAAGRNYLGDKEAALAVEGLTATRDATWTDLSPRERQILVMVARGKSSSEIGTQLHLSAKTVDTYRSRLMTKLNLGDVPAVVRWAIRNGLVSPDED
jgi:two-component system, NarL family, invasion response regulator UvrY